VNDKQKAVLDILRLLPNATNAELAAKLGRPVSRVTPRVLELLEKELVLDGG
jgi:DNA-binding IclR family transcriptional regulator